MKIHSFALMMLLAACAGRTATWEQKKDAGQATASTDEASALDQKADALFAERLTLEKAEAAATAYADAAGKAPTADRLTKLARAYYFLADTHYSIAQRKDDVLKTYKKGLEAGEQALVLAAPDFAKKMREGGKVPESVGLIPKEAVPAIYWYAVNLGKWARLEGMAVILYHKDNVRAYMERANALDEPYFYAAPPRYFGGMFAVAPAFAGGDLKKSEESFNKSLQLSPNYLATKVLMAELLMTKKQDRATFEKLLKEVIAADEKVHEDIVPEQTMEKKKAELLLAKVEDLF